MPITFLVVVGLAAILGVTTYRVRRSKVAAAVLLLAVAALTGATAFLRFGHWDAVPLIEPLSQVGQAGHREFQVSLGGPYDVVIAVKRLQGRDSPFGDPLRDSSPIDLDWQISTDKSDIATGSSRDAEGQIIGHFEAKPRTAYMLSYTVNESAPGSLDSQPEIRIQSDNRLEPFHSRRHLFPALFWSCVVTGFLGIAFLGGAVRVRKPDEPCVSKE